MASKNKSKTMIYIIASITVLLILIILNQIFSLNNRYRLFQPNSSFVKSIKEEIIFPSKGCPLPILKDFSNQRKYTILFSSEMNFDNSEITAEIESTICDNDKLKIPLSIISIKKKKSSECVKMGNLSEWLLSTFPYLYEVGFLIDKFPKFGIKRNILFDLILHVKDKTIAKNRCIFITENQENKYIMLATDIHISKRWDELEKDMQNIFPSVDREKNILQNNIHTIKYSDLFTYNIFQSSYSNPNNNFISFIKRANELYRVGKLDFIILSGDLVDYKYSKSRDKCQNSYNESEWYLFDQILEGNYPHSERLEAPFYTTTGNHDYRLYPYKIQIYGLRHCGIPDDFTIEYLKKSGQYSDFKYRLDDLDAVRINTGENHSLDYYYINYNPFDDYYFDLNNITRFVFLDTKSDAFCHFGHFFSKRIFRLISDLEHPPSQGFENSQIEFLNSLTDSTKEILLFCHAPILNTTNYYTGKESISEVKLPFIEIDKNNGLTDFDNEIAKLKLSFSTIFQNQFEVLRVLLKAKSSVTFSGHNHRFEEYGLSKTNNNLYRHYYSKTGSLLNYSKEKILLFQTQSLGHLQRSENEKIEPAFRLLVFSSGKLSEANQININEKPFDKIISHLSFLKKGNIIEVELFIKKSENFIHDINPLFHRFLVLFEPLKSQKGQPGLKVKLGSNVTLVNSFRDIDDRGFWIYEVNDSSLKIEIDNSTSRGRFQFALESYIKSQKEIKSLGLRRFHHVLE